MLLSMYVMLGSGLLLTAIFLLYRAEALAGRRFFLGTVRDKADRSLSRRFGGKVALRRYLGASSLRLLFHFLLHQALGLALAVIRAVEAHLNYLRRHNRLAARSVGDPHEDNHLHHIAKHKVATALSSEEKEVLKVRSLHD